MATLNQVQFIGYVGNIEKNGEGPLCIKMSLCTNRFYTELDFNPAPIWHQVVVFNKLAKQMLVLMNTKILQKGSLLFVQGKLDYLIGDISNKSVQIVAEKIQLLDK